MASTKKLSRRSYLDVDDLGWIEVADYERLLTLLGFDPTPDPGRGGGGSGGAEGGEGGGGGNQGSSAPTKRLPTQTDPNFETLMLLAPVVDFEEFYQILVLNDFPEKERPPDPDSTDASKFDDAARRRQQRRDELCKRRKKKKKEEEAEGKKRCVVS